MSKKEEMSYSFCSDTNCLPSTSVNMIDAAGMISIERNALIQKLFAEQLYNPSDIPPTQSQIDIVRFTWGHITDTRLPSDKPEISPSHAFGLTFYDTIFHTDPDFKKLFPNIIQQAKALGGMISYLVKSPEIINSPSSDDSTLHTQVSTIRQINASKRKRSTASTFSELVLETAADDTLGHLPDSDVDHFACKLQQLGSRHYRYGTQIDHFSLFGHAILKSIQARLGKDCLPEVLKAWTRVRLVTVAIPFIYANDL